ncbi:hypothetical protein T8K17_01210 [Thalassobaculum sp. OXR-137]|uniref:hypothetical protein n=1 Tax=Thalassobaculum sp. OXR-137 TaxID=3100173 RepID=UPI002AC93F84|nr:hypothetical protein [Thalassobaculum sp. OXR-137]WPZ34767.1 hypothetical protein T8K17_01210 [Thalassobaculum sp. OXR-137]
MLDELCTQLPLHGFTPVTADSNVGGKDYLGRIVDLIRGTGLTVAVFSHETRVTAFANICLELGMAVTFGKPIVVVKSEAAPPPSDLKRTDWIVLDPERPDPFRAKVRQAVEQLDGWVGFVEAQLETLAMASKPDCGIAFELAVKSFLISGEERFIGSAELLLERLGPADRDGAYSDLERLRQDIGVFVHQARRTL